MNDHHHAESPSKDIDAGDGFGLQVSGFRASGV